MSRTRTHLIRRANHDRVTILGGVIGRARDLLGGGDVEDLIRATRLVRLDAENAVTFAVLTERARGRTWDEVAQSLTEDPLWVARHYGAIEKRWMRGEDVTVPPLDEVEGHPSNG